MKITDEALIAAATLSNRYITDRFLPDKAIDLVDEACAMIRTEIDSMPTELDEISAARSCSMEIEEAALKKETDTLSQEHLAEIAEGAGRAAGRVQRDEGPVGERRRRPSARCRSCGRRSSRPTPRWRRPSGSTT